MFSGIFLNFWGILMLKKEGGPYWKFRTMQISLGWQEMRQISKKPVYMSYIWASKRTKNNLGRKSLATSASGKLVKRTVVCHSHFGIRKFLLPSTEILFIHQRHQSLQTWINIEATVDLIAYRLCVHCLWLLQKTFEHFLCFLYFWKEKVLTVSPDSSRPVMKEFFKYDCSFTVRSVSQGKRCWDL